MNGAGQAARLAVDRMTVLTGRHDLSECSLLTVGDLKLLHRKELVVEGKRWCCSCWRSDGDMGARYERKLWGLSVVEACPIHGTALVQRCFACGRRQPIIVRDVSVGVCGPCGADLCGVSAEGVLRDASDGGRQSWYAREAASLLDAVNVSQLLGFGESGLAEAREQGLAELLEHSTRARDYPAAVKQVLRWQQRWSRPILEELFSVLWRARWPIVKLFPGDVQKVMAEPPGSDGRNQLIRNQVSGVPAHIRSRPELQDMATQGQESSRGGGARARCQAVP